MFPNEPITPLCNLKYFEPGETEKYQFYKIPKILLTEPIFRENLDATAMILYGIMLSFTELSQKNGWIDENNHIYIIFPVDKVVEEFGISKKTAIRILKSLENVGLIERKSRNDFNRTKITYVKDFTSYATWSFSNVPSTRSVNFEGVNPTPSNGYENTPSREAKITPSNGKTSTLSNDAKLTLSNEPNSSPSLIDISNKYKNDSYMNNQHLSLIHI